MHWLIPHLAVQIVLIAVIIGIWGFIAVRGNGNLPWWVKLAALAMLFEYVNQWVHRFVMIGALSGYLKPGTIEVSASIRDVTLGFAVLAWVVFCRNWVRSSQPDARKP